MNCFTRRQDVQCHYKDNNCQVLSDLVRMSELKDYWLTLNLGVQDFTFRRANVDQARHDRVYACAGSGGLISAQHITTLLDHKAVVGDLEVAGS